MHFSKEIIKGAAEVLVLQNLAEGDAYGYALVARIAAMSDDIFTFQEGTVYPLLYRLEDRGFVESYVAPAPSGKSRRYYRVTKKGRTLLAAKKKELSTFIVGLQKALQLSVIPAPYQALP